MPVLAESLRRPRHVDQVLDPRLVSGGTVVLTQGTFI